MRTLLLVILPAILACGVHPAARADWLSNDEQTEMFCFSAQSDDGEALMGCAATSHSCAKMRSAAMEYGGLIKVAKVGKCGAMSVEPGE